MAYNTYSFADLNGTITCPGFISIPLTGAAVGQGNINISLTDNNTVHDRSADGHVMISKIKSDIGEISLEIHQTSPLNTALIKLYNFLIAAPSATWATIGINFDTVLGLPEIVNATGVSFSKRADKPYQNEGQNITWNFMAASIKYVL